VYDNNVRATPILSSSAFTIRMMSLTMQKPTSVPVRVQFLLLLGLSFVMHYAPKWSVTPISSKKSPYAWGLACIMMGINDKNCSRSVYIRQGHMHGCVAHARVIFFRVGYSPWHEYRCCVCAGMMKAKRQVNVYEFCTAQSSVCHGPASAGVE